MTRKQALEVCFVAGYHEDQKTFTRCYLSNRLSMAKAQEAYARGQRAKENGIPCTCGECKKG